MLGWDAVLIGVRSCWMLVTSSSFCLTKMLLFVECVGFNSDCFEVGNEVGSGKGSLGLR